MDKNTISWLIAIISHLFVTFVGIILVLTYLIGYDKESCNNAENSNNIKETETAIETEKIEIVKNIATLEEGIKCLEQMIKDLHDRKKDLQSIKDIVNKNNIDNDDIDSTLTALMKKADLGIKTLTNNNSTLESKLKKENTKYDNKENTNYDNKQNIKIAGNVLLYVGIFSGIICFWVKIMNNKTSNNKITSTSIV